MSKLQETVNELMEQVQRRDSKINQKIKDYQVDETKAKDIIDALVRKLVEYDLADDAQGQKDTNKKITQQKEILDDIQDKIGAYRDALNDPEIVKNKIPGIVALAQKEKENRHQTIEQKRAQRRKLEENMKNLERQIELIGDEINLLVQSQEAKVVRPLLKYIEKRPIKYGFENSYLGAYLNGTTGELLDQYIEVPSPAYQTRPVYGNVKMEGQRDTGEKLPPQKSFAELYGIVSSK
jgi:DNA repair exonuclease SbcCD ATPase subunit